MSPKSLSRVSKGGSALPENRSHRGVGRTKPLSSPVYRAVLVLAVFATISGLLALWAYFAEPSRSTQQDDRRSASRTPQSSSESDQINPKAVYRIRPNESHPFPMSAGRKDSFAGHGLQCLHHRQAGDRFTACVPPVFHCSRLVLDDFIGDDDVKAIRESMEGLIRVVGSGGGSGPVSLVELHQGVISKRDKFVSLHHALRDFREHGRPLPYVLDDALRYLGIVKRIHSVVSEALFCESFPCDSDDARNAAHNQGLATLFVAPPSFFSKIGTKPAVTPNDEYWHMHEDRIQYGSFAVTTLLYLNSISSGRSDDNSGDNSFEGGTFEFGGALPASVHPRRGRLSIFTSGQENPHWVAPVTAGYRMAMTTAFTCDREAGSSLAHDGPGSFLRELLDSL